MKEQQHRRQVVIVVVYFPNIRPMVIDERSQG